MPPALVKAQNDSSDCMINTDPADYDSEEEKEKINNRWTQINTDKILFFSSGVHLSFSVVNPLGFRARVAGLSIKPRVVSPWKVPILITSPRKRVTAVAAQVRLTNSNRVLSPATRASISFPSFPRVYTRGFMLPPATRA